MQPEFKKFRLSELVPAKYNPREIKSTSLDGLRHSLKKFGCVEPIVVNVRNNANVIVGGHQRHKALLSLHGADYECTCVAIDLSEVDEKALNATLNNPDIQGDFTDALSRQIEELKTNLDMEDFLGLRLNELSESIDEADIEIDDEKPEIEFTKELMEENNYLVIVFDNVMDWQTAMDMFGLETVKALDSKKGYEKQGIGRVVHSDKLMELVG